MKRTYRVWYLIVNPRKLLKDIVGQRLALQFKLFSDKRKEKE